MSSANPILVSCLPAMLTIPTYPSNTSVMICSKKILKSMGDGKHTCLELLSYRSIVEHCTSCIAV